MLAQPTISCFRSVAAHRRAPTRMAAAASAAVAVFSILITSASPPPLQSKASFHLGRPPASRNRTRQAALSRPPARGWRRRWPTRSTTTRRPAPGRKGREQGGVLRRFRAGGGGRRGGDWRRGVGGTRMFLVMWSLLVRSFAYTILGAIKSNHVD